MENGKWKVESGKWKMESGKWKMENGKPISSFSVIHFPFSITSLCGKISSDEL